MDGVALAATISGGAVGALGIISAWHSAAKERAFRSIDASAERAHSRLLARDERVWSGRRVAYQGLLVHLLNIMVGV